MKKLLRGTALATLAAILSGGLIAAVLFRYWISPATGQHREKPRPPGLVDDVPLVTAQRLSSLAATPEEQEFARTALRIADHEVDMAFAAALHNATEHAPPIPQTARPILEKVEQAQRRVKADQQEMAGLKRSLANADENAKPALQDRQELAQATLEVDQEDLEALRQELIRAGGDPRSKIEELKEQHESLNHEETGVAPGGTKPPAQSQEGESRILIVQLRGWHELSQKEQALAAARTEITTRELNLAKERKALDEETRQEGSQPDGDHDAAQNLVPADGHRTAVPASPSNTKVSALQHAAGERKHLAELDKRGADFQQLDSIYKDWTTLVRDRKRQYLMGVLEGTSWVLALLLVLIFANRVVRGVIAHAVPDIRRRHTVRIALRFAVQVTALLLILVVLFGPPSQVATVLALAGAGLTVALKDFIVGFFGWFILMGPNGIRPGDWVEINGISGEVVEVGLLHTVILETGEWSDAGHPTGRKVTVVNSFAIEGHYFNFSTTGQWLWDEIDVPIPPDVDPYPIAEAVQHMVEEETRDDVHLAEQEWQRAVPGHDTFAPGPAIMVRPTTHGVAVVARYVTRAHKRHEVRSRLFSRVVELLRTRHIGSGAVDKQLRAAVD